MLKGLDEICAGVELDKNRATELERGGLYKNDMEWDIEAALREAGLQVVGMLKETAQPEECAGMPTLWLEMSTYSYRELIFVSFRMNMTDNVVLGRNPDLNVMGATVWRTHGSTGSVGLSNAHQIRSAVRDEIGKFTKDDQKANP